MIFSFISIACKLNYNDGILTKQHILNCHKVRLCKFVLRYHLSTKIRRTLQSRCPSDFYVAVRGNELARDVASNACFYVFLFYQLKRIMLHCSRRFGGLRSKTLSPLPTARTVSEHTSSTYRIFIAPPLWRSSPRLHHHKQTASRKRCRLFSTKLCLSCQIMN